MDKDSTQVIAGIRISLITPFFTNYYTNIYYSSFDGAFSIYTHEETFTLSADDIDGITNGIYLLTNFSVTLQHDFYGYTTNIDILMTTNS